MIRGALCIHAAVTVVCSGHPFVLSTPNIIIVIIIIIIIISIIIINILLQRKKQKYGADHLNNNNDEANYKDNDKDGESCHDCDGKNNTIIAITVTVTVMLS